MFAPKERRPVPNSTNTVDENHPVATPAPVSLEQWRMRLGLSSESNKQPAADSSPEATFNEMSKQLDKDLRKSYSESFASEEDKKQPKEHGGVIIKQTDGDKTEYKVHNVGKGSRKNFTPDYKKIPNGWELAGDYHSHPYSQEEVNKFFNHPTEWDGQGMPFGKQDFISLANQQIKNGHVLIIEAGKYRYGLVITNKENYDIFVQSEGFEMFLDHIAQKQKEEQDSNHGKNLGKVTFDAIAESIDLIQQQSEKHFDVGFRVFYENIN